MDNVEEIKFDEECTIEVNTKNGYINATQLCKRAGRIWYTYYRSQKTKEFIKEICKLLSCQVSDIITSKVGGSHEGTWVNPLIATHLACWCSGEFGAKVSFWIENAKKQISTINEEWIESINKIKPCFKISVERLIRDKLSTELHGQVEVTSTHGLIDIVTDTEIIEIKHADKYKHAIGQVLAYSRDFPHLFKRIHLFHEDEVILSEYCEKAKSVCDPLQISVTHELVMIKM
jgi:hypothetical protein